MASVAFGGLCWLLAFVGYLWFLLTFGGFGWLLVACVGLGLFHCCTERDIPKTYQDMMVVLFYCILVTALSD